MELNNDNLEGKLTFDVRNQTCTIEGKVKDNDLKFRTTMKLLLTGGEITADEKNQVYRIKNADQVTIIMPRQITKTIILLTGTKRKICRMLSTPGSMTARKNLTMN